MKEGRTPLELTITGREGKQAIQIEWVVRDPRGKKLGTVSQKNDIPEGSLYGSWGGVAEQAAGAEELPLDLGRLADLLDPAVSVVSVMLANTPPMLECHYGVLQETLQLQGFFSAVSRVAPRNRRVLAGLPVRNGGPRSGFGRKGRIAARPAAMKSQTLSLERTACCAWIYSKTCSSCRRAPVSA